MRNLRLAFLPAVLALQACVPAQVAPGYPSHPTAIERTYVHNLGFKGFFASESTRTVSTRADMRRTEDEFQFTGFLMKHLAKSHDSATIWRVDKSKQWRLDLVEKTYTECPLAGCPSGRAPAPEPGRQESAPPERRKAPSCKLTLAKNRLSVEPTGQSKTINGFDAKQYKVSWELVLQDPAKKKDTSLVSIELWTTPESDARLAAVRAVDARFEQSLRAEAREKAGLGKVVPPEAMKILVSQLLGALTADQRAAATSAVAELGKIHGHPISTRLDWYLEGEACSAEGAPAEEAKAKPAGVDVVHGLGSFLSSVTQNGAEKVTDDMKGKPVFAFVEEVQEARVAQASDGLFVPPPSFRRR